MGSISQILKKLGEPSCNHHFLVGGFTNLEKSESQWEGLSHILRNIKKMKPPTINLDMFL
jgi:hypothetical protein